MTIISLILTVVLLACVTIILLFAINAERRLLAFVQGREGPSVAGAFGLFQTALDGLKVFLKTVVFSRATAKFSFFVFPVVLVLIGFFNWVLLPLSPDGAVVDFAYDIVLAYFLLSLDVLAFVCAAWSAFGSKFPTLSVLREILQMCAFELIIGFCFLVAALHAGTLSIHSCIDSQSVIWFGIIACPYIFLFYLSLLAELHRTPFDLTEAESELTAGYQSEHGGILFSLFFLCEYNGVLLLATLMSLLLLGGWHGFFWLGFVPQDQMVAVKAVFIFVSVLTVRAALPRTRMSAVWSMAWSSFLPAAINGFVLYLWVVFIVGALPFAEFLGVPARSREAVKVLLRGTLFDISLWTEFVMGDRDSRLDTSLGRRGTPLSPRWTAKVQALNENAWAAIPTLYESITQQYRMPSQMWPKNFRQYSFPFYAAWQFSWLGTRFNLTPEDQKGVSGALWGTWPHYHHYDFNWVRAVYPYGVIPGRYNYMQPNAWTALGESWSLQERKPVSERPEKWMDRVLISMPPV